MSKSFILLNKSQIYYYVYGSGPKVIIALHGFGQSGLYFKSLKNHLGQNFTIYAIDLPFHGQSRWEQDHFSRQDITNIIKTLVQKHQLPKFSFLGHSFGARIISSILNTFNPHLEAVFLLTPDGFGTRWLFLPEQMPISLRHWLQRQLQNPGWLMSIIKRLYRVQLIDTFVLKYLEYNLGEEKRRQRLFHTWNSLPLFKIQTKIFKENIQIGGYYLSIILGERDFLIPAKRILKKFKKEERIKVYILPKGHLLDAKQISQIILNTNFQS